MAQRIAILGASGVYGRHLTPRLIAAGYDVCAIVRRPEAAGIARACGADVRMADVFDAAALDEALQGCVMGINLATSLPGPSGRGDFAVNDRVRRDGTPLWLAACERAGVRRVVQQSIAMVNAAGDLWADEETRLSAPVIDITRDAIAASLAMEDAVRGSALDWIILRGGLFYGPGTGFDDDWYARAAAGKLRLPEDGSAFVSLVHIADMAAATLAALEAWPSRETLIVADDAPARWRDVFGFVAAAADAAAPQAGGRPGFPSFRVSNAKAKRLLGWSPRYEDYRVGLVR